MKNKSVSIQLIRILAMFSIILCHLVQELNDPLLEKAGQLFNNYNVFCDGVCFTAIMQGDC